MVEMEHERWIGGLSPRDLVSFGRSSLRRKFKSVRSLKQKDGGTMLETIDQIEHWFVQLVPEEQAKVLQRLTVRSRSNGLTQTTSDAAAIIAKRDESWERLFEIGAKIAAADQGGPSATEDLTNGRR